ncbi:MAG: elongation factor G [Ignavibacteriae bacterium]|nr:elongation factor G [Ignavibacteriota bacterium]
MPDYKSEQIRNVSVIGHAGTGKTSFCEAVLFSSGVTNRMGNVTEGNTVSDYHEDEIEKQMSINASVMNAFWKKSKGDKIKINLIDTPGFMDYIGEVVSALRVSDTSIITLDASKGREVGTEITFHNTKHYRNNIIFVINKLDHENINFEKVIDQLRESFGSRVAVMQFPVNSGTGFNAVVDVAKMKLLKFSTDGSGNYTEEDIPEDQKAKAKEYHQRFVENIAEEDEELMEKFFEGDENLAPEDIEKGLLLGMQERKIFPVFCAAADKNIGIKPILDFIADYTESPLDKHPEHAHKPGSDSEVEVKADPNGEPTIFIFKTVSEKNIGELSFFRVYSGKVTHGMDMVNEANGKSERLSQLFSMNGKNRKEMDAVICGDIGAVVKLKDTHTNNTLSSKSNPVVLPNIKFPDPNITLAIHAKNKGDEDKIATALHSFHEEDPTFISSYIPETRETVISGQGESHLETVIKRMKEKYKLEVEVKDPKIPYRETIRSTASDVEYKHKKQSGGRGQFGHVHIKIEPLERGQGFEFVDKIVGGVIPGRFVPAVEKGINEVLKNGVVVGCPVIDVKVTLFDGSFHNVDSDENSFKIAGSMAFRKGFMEAAPVIMEPIYDVEVVFPEEFMGAVSGDVSSRRGRIQGMEAEGHLQKLKAQIPLSEMNGYSSTLRSLTQGRGTYKRKFSHYEDVPREVEMKIIEQYKAEKEEAA